MKRGAHLNQVVNETWSNDRNYKLTVTLSFKLVKFVNEEEQHGRAHLK
jgi:hypothetical protein